MYHKQMKDAKDAIRKALCLSDLVGVIKSKSVDGFVRWLNEWTEEERTKLRRIWKYWLNWKGSSIRS